MKEIFLFKNYNYIFHLYSNECCLYCNVNYFFLILVIYDIWHWSVNVETFLPKIYFFIFSLAYIREVSMNILLQENMLSHSHSLVYNEQTGPRQRRWAKFSERKYVLARAETVFVRCLILVEPILFLKHDMQSARKIDS